MDALHFSRKGVMGLVLSLLVSTEIVYAGTLYVDANGVAGYGTISAAVEASQSGDTIILLPGTYGGVGNTNVQIEDKVLTICGSDPNDPAITAATVIDCSTTDAEYSRAFEIVGTASPTNVTIAGLTFAKGVRAYEGGVVLCQQANLTLINCTIQNSDASWWGGGLYVLDSRATIQGCSFRGNVSDNLDGGAVCCRNSVVDVTNGAFDDNRGGAIQAYDSSLTLSRCSFTDNTGDKGGAVYAYVSRESVSQTHLILNGCTFVRNSAATLAGAMYIENVPATITGCTFTADAAAADGGAIYSSWSSPAISNCLFIGNSAVGRGGALFHWNQSSPEIVNCTFVANVAASGGVAASQLDGTTLFRNCILWNNAAPQGKNLYIARQTGGQVNYAKMTVQYSDVQGGKASAVVESGCTLTWGAGNLDADPLFIGPFQSDYHLSPDSPCIDAGDPAFVPSADAVDLDGYPRLFGGHVDLGAFEYQGLGPVYRFWSESLGTHFYTISGSERDKLVNKYSHIWQLEEIAYYAYFRKSEANLTPVYRFWSPALASHAWTSNEDEKQKLMQQSDTWQYEGIVFYVYPARKQPFSAVPVYRFWSTRSGDHFYTVSESEKSKLVSQYPGEWAYEGVAWYAFAHPNHMGAAAYQFTGGSKTAMYTMTLEAYIDGAKADIDQPLIQFDPQRTQAQMTIDFPNLTTTLDELHVQTQNVQHTATFTRPGLTMMMTLSAQASFDGLCQRGPFTIDPDTNLFADFTNAAKTLNGNLETFTCNGTATLGGLSITFSYSASAVQFELCGAGVFESIVLLPDGLYAYMPLTFQWHRPYVKDLLVETSVSGHLVQVYVTNMYVGTLDLWEGHIVK